MKYFIIGMDEDYEECQDSGEGFFLTPDDVFIENALETELYDELGQPFFLQSKYV